MTSMNKCVKMIRSGKAYTTKQIIKAIKDIPLYYFVRRFITGDAAFINLVNVVKNDRHMTRKKLMQKERCNRTTARWAVRMANSKLKPGVVKRAAKPVVVQTPEKVYPRTLYLRFGAIQLPECLQNNPGLLEYTNAVVKMIDPQFGKIEMLTGEDKITQLMEVR